MWNAIFEFFENCYMWIAYRCIPRHRYNVIRTGLKPGYYDLDSRLQEAVRQLVIDFVEIEIAALAGSKKYRDRSAALNYLRKYTVTPVDQLWAEYGEEAAISLQNMESDLCRFYKDLAEMYLFFKQGSYLLEEDYTNKLHVWSELFSKEDWDKSSDVISAANREANRAEEKLEQMWTKYLTMAISLRHRMWT